MNWPSKGSTKYDALSICKEVENYNWSLYFNSSLIELIITAMQFMDYYTHECSSDWLKNVHLIACIWLLIYQVRKVAYK